MQNLNSPKKSLFSYNLKSLSKSCLTNINYNMICYSYLFIVFTIFIFKLWYVGKHIHIIILNVFLHTFIYTNMFFFYCNISVSSSTQLIVKDTELIIINNDVVGGGLYDPVSNQTLSKFETFNNNNISSTKQTLRQRPPFFGGGGGRRCSCLDSNCGCCAGLRLVRLNFSRLRRFLKKYYNIYN